MTRLAAPLIIDAHMLTLPTLTGWGRDGHRPPVRVFQSGVPTREDLRRWCTVGYVAGDEGPAVHLEPVHDAQNQNREAGSIACQLVAAAADFGAARTALFDLLLPWSAWLSADPTLRGDPDQAPRLLPGSSLSLVADVASATTRAGATASAVVTITYTAVSYG
jgi:hypothetical protein